MRPVTHEPSGHETLSASKCTIRFQVMGEDVDWDEVADLVADSHQPTAPRQACLRSPDTGAW
jgi:hypothetical protein